MSPDNALGALIRAIVREEIAAALGREVVPQVDETALRARVVERVARMKNPTPRASSRTRARTSAR